jgi:hypothetical protein
MDQTKALMQRIIAALDQGLPGHGITVLIFPRSGPEGARVNYVSNCDRADMLMALKEVVARFEGRVQTTETRQ